MEFIGDRQVVIVVVVTTFLGWNLNVCKVHNDTVLLLVCITR